MERKRIIIIISSVAVVFLALFGYLFITKETKIVGKILSLSGLVEAQKSATDQFVKVFSNMAFSEGDRLQTGEDGNVELQLGVNKKVEVFPSTTLEFTELVKSINAKGGKTFIDLNGGKVKVTIDEKLKGESRFQIKTPNAIMGVMGTEFYVYYDGTGTWVGVLSGVVEVQSGPNGEKQILVPGNEYIYIGEDGSIQEGELTEELIQFFSANTEVSLINDDNSETDSNHESTETSEQDEDTEDHETDTVVSNSNTVTNVNNNGNPIVTIPQTTAPIVSTPPSTSDGSEGEESPTIDEQTGNGEEINDETDSNVEEPPPLQCEGILNEKGECITSEPQIPVDEGDGDSNDNGSPNDDDSGIIGTDPNTPNPGGDSHICPNGTTVATEAECATEGYECPNGEIVETEAECATEGYECPNGEIVETEAECATKGYECPNGEIVETEAECATEGYECPNGEIVETEAECATEGYECPNGEIVETEAECATEGYECPNGEMVETEAECPTEGYECLDEESEKSSSLSIE